MRSADISSTWVLFLDRASFGSFTMPRIKYASKEERVEAKKKNDRDRMKSRVLLKDQKGRWEQFKTDKLLSTDEQVAAVLLDSYYKWETTSTPAPKKARVVFNPSVSSIHTLGADVMEVDISGMEELDGELVETLEADLTEFTDDGEKTMTSRDADYHPTDDSVLVYSRTVGPFGPSDVMELQPLDPEELVANIEGDDQVEEVSIVDSQDEPATRATVSAEEAVCENHVIASISCLLDLANMAPPSNCTKCNGVSELALKTKTFGSSLIITWVCSNGHVVRRWLSQRRLTTKGVNTGDAMLASAITLSGNNYEKIRLLCRFMNLSCIGPTLFHEMQHYFVVPAVEEHWKTVQQSNLEKYQGKAIVVAGDGRNDSPGHSAQYCTYTIMEHDSHDILAIFTADKRHVALKSPNMEKLAWEQAVAIVESADVTISEMVTDAHIQITAAMNKKGMRQSFDVWHGAKNMNKKLHESIGAKKDFAVLKPWVRDIVNHFWYCAEQCNGDKREFKVLWIGMLSHVRNKHEWVDPFNGQIRQCAHEDLSDDDRGAKEWLMDKSPAMDLLRGLVYDEKFLKKSEKYVNFRHTGELEVFHQHILMYASKRFSFSFDVYKARIFLAAIDYQAHKDRAYAKTRDGEERYKRIYNKRTDHWFPIKVKEPKEYSYVQSLMKDILNRRLAAEPSSLRQHWEISADHPKHIAPNLARNPAQPTAELVSQHKSRMSKSAEMVPVNEDSERQDDEA